MVALLAAAACTDSPTLVERPAQAVRTLVIRDVRVLDVVTGSVAAHRDVRVEGDRITAIVPSEAGARVEADRVIDGAGATLLPGLIDVHGHTGGSSDAPWATGRPNPELHLARWLYAGVTTVFDPGGMDDDSFERRARVERGELLGPRLFVAGPMFTAPGGHPIPLLEHNLPTILHWYVIGGSTRQVASPYEAVEAVRALLPSKPDFVKMVVDRLPPSAPCLGPETHRAITETARAGGVRTVAHIGSTADAIAAAEAGVSAWMHGVYKERIPDEDVARLAAFGIPMAPTLVVFDSYATLGREPRSATELERQTVPAEALAAYDRRPADYEVPEEMTAVILALARERQNALENVRRLHAAKVVILAGSDAQAGVVHGAGLHRELALLAKAGLPPLEVLRAATLHPARFLTAREDPPFGVVAPGKTADLLLVEGDPLEDLTAVSRIRQVVVRGVPLSRSSLPGS